jgi:hypothetical protein
VRLLSRLFRVIFADESGRRQFWRLMSFSSRLIFKKSVRNEMHNYTAAIKIERLHMHANESLIKSINASARTIKSLILGCPDQKKSPLKFKLRTTKLFRSSWGINYKLFENLKFVSFQKFFVNFLLSCYEFHSVFKHRQ